jgi:predicted nuclease of predicted toxin-antitoxin system
VKFLIDMPLSPALAGWLIQQGHDAVHATELGLAFAADSEILERARHECRVVVTADLDYPRLLAYSHSQDPGLILFRGGNYSEQESFDRLERTLAVIPHEELPRSVIVIEKGRIRRTRLPLDFNSCPLTSEP